MKRRLYRLIYDVSFVMRAGRGPAPIGKADSPGGLFRKLNWIGLEYPILAARDADSEHWLEQGVCVAVEV